MRLHQPSAHYGVPSRELASGDKDQHGLNAGRHSMALWVGGKVVDGTHAPWRASASWSGLGALD